MRKIFLTICAGCLLVVGCSSSNSNQSTNTELDESIKSTVYYEQIQMVWELLDDPNKITVCEFVDGVNDEGAIAAFAIALKFDLDIDYDSNKDKFDKAIKLFVKEKC